MTIDASRSHSARTRTRAEDSPTARAALCQAVLAKQLPADEFPRRYSEAVDEWLRDVFDDATHGKPRGCALIAVGGYGRGQLYPGSDLDLLLLHRARRDFQRVAHDVWYGIWDKGVRLDHSVRTRREALSIATTDLKVVLGLLDGRLVAGDSQLAERLLSQIPATWQKSAPGLLSEFERQVALRHEKFGELAFLLEPDLKNSSGGQRDLAALRALAVLHPQLAPLATQPAIVESERVIGAARVVLHSRMNSANDRLLLQEQDFVADVLGYADADELMARVSEAGRTISSTAAEAWRRTKYELRGNRTKQPASCDLGNGIEVRDGEVGLGASADAKSAMTVLNLARAAVELNLPMELTSLDRLASNVVRPSEPWSTPLRESFIALLSSGNALVPVVEALDQRRLFEVFLPEWRAVRNRPQRNAYHRFTVDRHLLETVALCAEQLPSIARPDLLIMGALLHDIGKGYEGDHSQGGSQIAKTVGERMGFSRSDVTVLSNLVSFHLVLPEFAIRRDLDDPSTASVVAKLVDNRLTLDLLAALAEVDGRATGSAAWGPWKAELVASLTDKAAQVLAGHPVEAPSYTPTKEQRALLEEGRVAVRASGRTVTVVAPDQPGLLAVVAGVLALNGANVRRANLGEGSPGMAIDVFYVEPAFNELPDWARVEVDLIAALEDPDPIESRLEARDVTYARGRRPAAASPPRVRVAIDNDTSAIATIVEVQAPDRLGLLHAIAKAFASQHHDVVSALVDTLGHEVIDTFYVRNASGEKLRPEQADDVASLLGDVLCHAA